MLKKIIPILIFLVSCKKIELTTSIQSQKAKPIIESAVDNLVGDPTRSPDLRPVENETGYSGTFPIGVRTTWFGNYPWVYKDSSGGTGTWIKYVCPIANNGAPSSNFYSPLLPYTGDTHYSGADFIFKFHTDSSGAYVGVTNPQFLYRAVFQNGLPVSTPSENYKINWEGVDGFLMKIYNPTLDNNTYLNYYSGDTGVLHPMFMDYYYNSVKLPDNPSGKYVVVITVNQESYIAPHSRLFNESDYSNNTVTLPVSVNGYGLAQVDTTALSENRPVPVANLTAKALRNANDKGKIRAIRLDWVCPYHATGVIHKFKIVRSDGVVYDNLWDEGFTDTSLPNRFSQLSYTVYIKIEGLGVSNPATVGL